MSDLQLPLEAKRAALLKRIHEAETRQSKASDKVYALRAELTTAEADLNQTESTTSAAIDDCSKFEARLLADAIHSRLPRELRDIVYGMFWKEELEKFDYYTNERPWRAHDIDDEEPQDMCACSYETRNPPLRGQALEPYDAHLIDADYVGMTAAREAAEAFYRTAPAYIETLDAEKFEEYLTEDNFGLGLVPRDYLSSMVFFLDPCMREPRDQVCHPDPMPRDLDIEALNAMIGRDQKKLPSITFLLKNVGTVRAMRALINAESLYYQLKSHGANITIIFEWEEEDGGLVIKPINLGAIIEKEETKRIDHFIEVALEQYGEGAVFKMTAVRDR